MTLGKHFINGVKDPVVRALRASLYCNPNLRLLEKEKVLYRQPAAHEDKVLILSGGGAGHEPAYAGYLGDGMLDIAVAGQIFASPSATQVLAGIRAVESSKGILLVVKNYTGDKLNFGLAAESAKADGLKVEVVFVEDDCSVQGNTLVGQRGLAGVVLVLKISGALAATGASLEEVASVARYTASRLATAAVSLDKCSVPNRGLQESIPGGMLEYGMGIHNEPGVSRDTLGSLQETVKRVIDMLRPNTGLDNDMALLVNNLGGLSVLELNVIADESIQQFKKRGNNVVRVVVGTFLTSLDGPGFSLTLLALDATLEPLLDAPCSASAWPKITLCDPNKVNDQLCSGLPAIAKENSNISNTTFQLKMATSLLKTIVQSVVRTTHQDEPMITRYDTLAGDGDCGETLISGINRFSKEIQSVTDEKVAVYDIVQHAARGAEHGMGGTSGALYAIFFNALGSALRQRSEDHSWSVLPACLDQALAELCKYTLARVGHRTLMDALIPFIETLREGDLEKAYQAARDGADSTRNLTPAMGRASYVGEDVFKREVGIPDPGALGVVSIIRGILEGLKGEKVKLQVG